MTSAFKIHDTVLKVSFEARFLVPPPPIITDENKLLAELILCILSSQEKYEAALAIVKLMKADDIIQLPKNKLELNKIKPLITSFLSKTVGFIYNGKNYSRRIRFHEKKASYICRTLETLHDNKLTINKILRLDRCKLQTRKNIIKYSFGLGPKQASMFLRNVGYYTEFAVLDKHVIEYLRLMGIIDVSRESFSSILEYQKVENRLKSYATTYDVNLLHLDIGIWTTMRTLKNAWNETRNTGIWRH